MKMQKLFYLNIFIILVISCNKDPEGPKQPTPIILTDKSHEVITSSNAFGVDLFRVTAMEEK
jgi:hypothetical protein